MLSGAHVEFRAWLENNGMRIPKHLEVRRCPSAGNGLFTTKAIEAGETVVDVPSNLILTGPKSRQSLVGQHLVKMKAPPRTIMHLWLIAERHVHDSFFGPYLRSLPTTYSDPMWWDDEDRALLSGTNMFSAVQTREREIEEELEQYAVPLSGMHPDVFPSELCTRAHLLWARSTLTSRGFPARLVPAGDGYIPPGERDVGCLIPFADYFNHSAPGPSTCQEWVVTDRSVAFRGVDGFHAAVGDQVFTNYGAKSNEEFLLGYGFTIPDNSADHVTVALSAPPDTFYLTRLGIPPGLVHALRRRAMTDRERYVFDGDATRPINDENEAAVHDALRDMFRRSLSKLGPTPAKAGSTKAANARHYRSGQVDILETCLGQVAEAPAGDILYAVDLGDVMTADGVLQSWPTLRMIDGLDDIAVLTVAMTRAIADSSSAWSSISCETLPVSWTDAQLAALGPGHSPARRAIDAAREDVHDLYGQLFPMLSDQVPDEFPPDVFTVDRFVQAAALVDAHSIQVPGVAATLVVPMPALPVHAATNPTARFVVDADRQRLHLCRIRSGDQVTARLGLSLSNTDLLVSFGQVLPCNPFDAIDVGVECDDLPGVGHALTLANGIPDRLQQAYDVGTLARIIETVSSIANGDPACDSLSARQRRLVQAYHDALRAVVDEARAALRLSTSYD
ncbi:SET domain-containing protein [Plasmodiophora brassicae]